MPVVGSSLASLTRSNTLVLLLPILPYLPEAFFHHSPPVSVVFSNDDRPLGMVHSSFRDRSESLGRSGKGAFHRLVGPLTHSMEQVSTWQSRDRYALDIRLVSCPLVCTGTSADLVGNGAVQKDHP